MLRELLRQEPLLAAALAAVLAAVVYHQRRMTPGRAVRLTPTKQAACRLLDPVSRRVLGLRLVSEKDHSELVMRVDATPEEVITAIHPPFQPNLTSNAKFRMVDRAEDWRKQWCHSQWAFRYEDERGRQRQTHVYLFRAPPTVQHPEGVTGGADVYVHVEDDPRDPGEHLDSDDHHPGDTDGKLAGVLQRAGIWPRQPEDVDDGLRADGGTDDGTDDDTDDDNDDGRRTPKDWRGGRGPRYQSERPTNVDTDGTYDPQIEEHDNRPASWVNVEFDAEQ